MKRNKDEDVQITPEEKEMLRRLMETPGIEKDWDFFQDLNMDVPPPEFFMRGRPERHIGLRRIGRKALKAGGFVACVLICAMIIAPFMVPDTANADKTPFQILAENIRNGFAEIKPQGEDMEDNYYITKIENIDDVKTVGRKAFPDLRIPTYICEQYVFRELVITKVDNENKNITATYIFDDTSGNSSLKIDQFATEQDAGAAFNDILSSGEPIIGNLYFHKSEASDNNILTVWYDKKNHVVISGVVDNVELEKVFEGLQ